MEILAHRGLWHEPNEKNTYEAIKAAFDGGFGIESDVRDQNGSLVISHDIPDLDSLPAERVFEIMSSCENVPCFAINIKADGLDELLTRMLNKYAISNYFTFDMSVPQMVRYAKNHLTFFTRQSEYESTPIMYEQASGVWIDGFERFDWITENLLKRHIENGKIVCVVSPELHGIRDYRMFWEALIVWNLCFSKVLLCTDYPEEAKGFFRDKLKEKAK